MPKIKHRDWSPEYMEWLFTYWYNHGRLSATKFYQIIPRIQSTEYPSEFLDKHFAIPDVFVLKDFIDLDFVPRANQLDLDARQTIDTTLVAEKVEMLKRHAQVGFQMQTMALDYLEAHKEDLGVNNAVKLLVEGLRTERESKGIPATLERMSSMSDEQLLKEIQKIIVDSPIEMLPQNGDDEIIVNGTMEDA